MLRITRIDEQRSSPLFKLEGWLLEPWVSEVRRVCSPSDEFGGPVRLDLSALLFADQSGIQLLRELIALGVSVSSCSPFIAQLLDEESHE